MVTKTNETIAVAAPNILTASFDIEGTAPYVQHKFSAKTKQEMLSAQMSGLKSKNRKKTDVRKPNEEFEEATYKMIEPGKKKPSYGIPAPAFRAAMISACRLVGFQMTKAKLSVFVEQDGIDIEDATPLVKIDGKRTMLESNVRLANGTAYINFRPMWQEWKAKVKVRFDADQFSIGDVANLLTRVGLQVGVGEGRPDSKTSNGMGWGLFQISNAES